MDDELRAIKQKFQLMEKEQAKHTEDIGKAWGYIMADEAAEDVANSGALDEWGDDDEMYRKMTEKALRIASSQTTTKLKQAFGTYRGRCCFCIYMPAIDRSRSDCRYQRAGGR